MEKNSSKNILDVIAIIISLLALVACLFVVCMILRKENSFNVVSLIIAAFSVITAVLIGMQIWNVFQFEKKFEFVREKSSEEIERSKNDILALNQKELKKTRAESIGVVLMQLGWVYEDRKEYGDAMRAYINSLRSLQQGNLNDIVEEYNDVVERLQILSTILPADDWHFVNIYEKNVFIDTVMKIPNEEIKNQLLAFFYNFSVLKDFPKKGYRAPSLSDTTTWRNQK